MLKLTLEGGEYFNEETEEFYDLDNVDLVMEHSLVSLSKWESKYQKPFLSDTPKTTEEILSYIECMIVSPDFPPGDLRERLSQDHIDAVNEYIQSPQSATTFGEMPERKGRGEVITAELIYFWMVSFTIPFETERWHLNRLFALVRICNIKNAKPKKMSKGEMARRYADLNAKRKAELGTRG